MWKIGLLQYIAPKYRFTQNIPPTYRFVRARLKLSYREQGLMSSEPVVQSFQHSPPHPRLMINRTFYR